MPNGSLISYYGFVDTLQPVHQERSQPKRETWLSLIYIDFTWHKNRIEIEI